MFVVEHAHGEHERHVQEGCELDLMLLALGGDARQRRFVHHERAELGRVALGDVDQIAQADQRSMLATARRYRADDARLLFAARQMLEAHVGRARRRLGVQKAGRLDVLALHLGLSARRSIGEDVLFGRQDARRHGGELLVRVTLCVYLLDEREELEQTRVRAATVHDAVVEGEHDCVDFEMLLLWLLLLLLRLRFVDAEEGQAPEELVVAVNGHGGLALQQQLPDVVAVVRHVVGRFDVQQVHVGQAVDARLAREREVRLFDNNSVRCAHVARDNATAEESVHLLPLVDGQANDGQVLVEVDVGLDYERPVDVAARRLHRTVVDLLDRTEASYGWCRCFVRADDVRCCRLFLFLFERRRFRLVDDCQLIELFRWGCGCRSATAIR